MSVMLYPCILCVALLLDLFVFVCCVFHSVCEWFGETISNIFVVLLLLCCCNVMVVFSVGGACLC